MPRKKKEIGKNRIREFRMKAGLSSGQLARKIGVDAPKMSRLENGKQRPSLEELAKLSGVLGVNSNEIIDLPISVKSAACDNALLTSAISWLAEAAGQVKITLSPQDLSKWASYVYKEAVEQPLDFKRTKYLAFTIIKVIKATKDGK